MSVPEPLQAAQRALDWLQKHAVREISLIQLYQKGPREIRTARPASDIADILEEHGWLERSGTVKRTPVWRLVADDGLMARPAAKPAKAAQILAI